MRIFLLLSLCLLLGRLDAQDVRFFAKVSSDTLLAGHLLQLTYTIEHADVDRFKPPSFDGLILVNGPQKSSSMQIANGVMRREASITYLLATQKPGEIVLEPARIVMEGRELECQRMYITVLPNPGELPDPQFPGWRPREQPRSAPDSIRERLGTHRRSYRL
jgi:hypothetical protein